MTAKILCLFDANGTLFADLADIWYPSVTKIFEVCGKTPFTPEEYFRELEDCKGNYLHIYRSHGITLPKKDLNAIYATEYGKRIDAVKLAPGIKEALRALQRLGCKMGIITLQTKSLFCPLMDKFGLWEFFDKECVCWEIADKKTVISRLAHKSGVPTQYCCYIGDTPSDMRHAKGAGVMAIAYLNGFVPEDLMRKTEPRYVLSHFSDLPPLVRNML